VSAAGTASAAACTSAERRESTVADRGSVAAQSTTSARAAETHAVGEAEAEIITKVRDGLVVGEASRTEQLVSSGRLQRHHEEGEGLIVGLEEARLGRAHSGRARPSHRRGG